MDVLDAIRILSEAFEAAGLTVAQRDEVYGAIYRAGRKEGRQNAIHDALNALCAVRDAEVPA